MDIILLGVIIVIALVLFITELFPIDVTALVVLGLLLIFGLVTPEQSLSGFSNPAVITIGCLFIMSYALQKSHVLEYVIININKIIDQSQTLGMAVYLFCIGIASAVVNNTAIVAIFMPVTIRLADKYNISPSKVLIPLSYAAILGGTLTLVGTSTNLIVNSVLVVSTGESLGMLEFAKFGIIKFVVGLIYIFTIGHKLLPSRVAKSSSITDYSLDGYLTEFKINENSPLCGKTLLDRKINENYDVIVLDVLRGGEIITSNLRSLILKEGDVLFVKGSFENFQRLKEIENLALLTDEKLTQEELVRILIEPKNSIISQFKMLFALDNVELEVGDEALQAIANIAHEDTTGARGLRSVIEKSLLKTQFKLPKLAKDGLIKVIITKEFISGDTDKPILVYKEKHRHLDGAFYKSIDC